MKPKRLIPLFCFAAGIVMCVFLARLASVERTALSQIILFYVSLALLVTALLVHMILHREDNDSSLHYVYKLMSIVFLYTALIVFMLCDIFLV